MSPQPNDNASQESQAGSLQDTESCPSCNQDGIYDYSQELNVNPKNYEKVNDYNPQIEHDKTRHFIIKTLLELLAFFLCASCFFIFSYPYFALQNGGGFEWIEKVSIFLDKFFAPLISLVSGAMGYYFGSEQKKGGNV